MEVDLPGWLVVTAIVHTSTEGFIPQVVVGAIGGVVEVLEFKGIMTMAPEGYQLPTHTPLPDDGWSSCTQSPIARGCGPPQGRPHPIHVVNCLPWVDGYLEVVPQAKLADGAGKRYAQVTERPDRLVQPNCQQDTEPTRDPNLLPATLHSAPDIGQSQRL